MTNFAFVLRSIPTLLSTCLVPVLLTNIGAIGQSRLGRRGSRALRVYGQSIQAAVDSECTIVLDGSIQGNVAAAGGLGCSVAVAGEGALLEGTNTLTRSLISANALGRFDLGGGDMRLCLAGIRLARICFTRMKSFFTSKRHDFIR